MKTFTLTIKDVLGSAGGYATVNGIDYDVTAHAYFTRQGDDGPIELADLEVTGKLYVQVYPHGNTEPVGIAVDESEFKRSTRDAIDSAIEKIAQGMAEEAPDHLWQLMDEE